MKDHGQRRWPRAVDRREPQDVFDRSSASMTDAAQLPPTEWQSPLIFLIDPRALTRECLLHGLRAAGGFPNLVALPAPDVDFQAFGSPDLLVLNIGVEPANNAVAAR